MATQQRRRKGDGSLEQLPSGKWRGRYWNLAHTKLLSTPACRTQEDAATLLRRAIVDQEREGYELAPRSVTVSAMIDVWLPIIQRRRKPRTAERYEDHISHIRALLGDEPVAQLNYARLQQFVAELEAIGLSPKTIRGCYGVLQLVLQHAQKLGKMHRSIPKPDLPRVEPPKLRIPTRDEVDRLAQASDARLWAAVTLAGYCGLREGEILALHRNDVHLDTTKIGDDIVPPHVFVHQARNKSSGAFESTKTGSVRRVYLPDPVVTALKQHLDEYPDGDLVVPVSASVMQKSWERARTACGLRGVRFHDLRHAAASMMIAAGLSVKEVSEQLGHANATQTLDTYTHLWPRSWGTAMGRMNAYLET